MTRQRQVRADFDATGALDLGTGLLGDVGAERVARDSGGPHLAQALDPLDRAVLAGQFDAGGVQIGHHDAEAHLDAELGQLAAGDRAELVAERGQHLGGAVDQQHPGRAGVDVAEVAGQRGAGQLPDLPGHLHPGGAGADDHEGQQARPDRRVRLQLGQLEGAEDPAAQFQGVVEGLHAGRVRREVVPPEIALAGAGGQDQEVVRRTGLLVVEPRGHHALGDVDVRDQALQHGGVALAPQDRAGGRGDLALGQDAGGDLVEQRLEQVRRALGDQGDVDVGAPQVLRGEQPAKARPDDDDPMPLARMLPHAPHPLLRRVRPPPRGRRRHLDRW